MYYGHERFMGYNVSFFWVCHSISSFGFVTALILALLTANPLFATGSYGIGTMLW